MTVVNLNQRGKIRVFLEEHPRESFRTAELWELLGKERGFGDVTSMATLLPKMFNEGEIDKVEKGLYSALQASIPHGMEEEVVPSAPVTSEETVEEVMSEKEPSNVTDRDIESLNVTLEFWLNRRIATEKAEIAELKKKVGEQDTKIMELSGQLEEAREMRAKADEIVLCFAEASKSFRNGYYDLSKGFNLLEELLPGCLSTEPAEEETLAVDAEEEVNSDTGSPFEQE
jgi:hypothetical protein